MDSAKKKHFSVEGLLGSCCCSVRQSCPALCDSTNCSTPGFPVLRYLLEFAQTHVHWVDDAIQPSYPLSPPSPPAFNLSQNQGLFQWVSSSCQVAKVLKLQLRHQSFQCIGLISFMIDWFDILAVHRPSRVFSSTTAKKHKFLGAQLSLWSNSHIHMWLLEKPELWLDGLLSAKWCLCFFFN